MAPTVSQITAYDKNVADQTETATFALGCFWGPDAQFGALEGVVRTRVGYAGGSKTDPTYYDLGGHTEAFQVDYDPDRRPFAELLELAFRSHNPTQQSRKTQYQNIIFFNSDTQRETLTEFLTSRNQTAEEIETRVEQLSAFHPAEPYHQKHSLRNKRALLQPFEDAGYDATAIRESPAAAKLNGYAAGHELPDSIDLGIADNRTVHRS